MSAKGTRAVALDACKMAHTRIGIIVRIFNSCHDPSPLVRARLLYLHIPISDHLKNKPPFTSIVAPVTKPASSEAR